MLRRGVARRARRSSARCFWENLAQASQVRSSERPKVNHRLYASFQWNRMSTVFRSLSRPSARLQRTTRTMRGRFISFSSINPHYRGSARDYDPVRGQGGATEGHSTERTRISWSWPTRWTEDTRHAPKCVDRLILNCISSVSAASERAIARHCITTGRNHREKRFSQEWIDWADQRQPCSYAINWPKPINWSFAASDLFRSSPVQTEEQKRINFSFSIQNSICRGPFFIFIRKSNDYCS